MSDTVFTPEKNPGLEGHPITQDLDQERLDLLRTMNEHINDETKHILDTLSEYLTQKSNISDLQVLTSNKSTKEI